VGGGSDPLARKSVGAPAGISSPQRALSRPWATVRRGFSATARPTNRSKFARLWFPDPPGEERRRDDSDQAGQDGTERSLAGGEPDPIGGWVNVRRVPQQVTAPRDRTTARAS